MKILLIDDSDIDQQITALAIRKGLPDAQLTMLDDAEGLLEHLVTHQYDCILLDYSMPNLSGLQVMDMLNAAYENPFRPPVVMLTGMGDEKVAVEAMRKGAYDYLRKDDIDANLIARTVEATVKRVRLERELQHSNRMLAMLALTDDVTKLSNRNAFDLALGNALQTAAREQQPVYLLVAEIVAFREFARQRGRSAGDVVLKHVARNLRGVMRPDDSLFRIGDDQFAVLVERRIQPRTAEVIAVRMLEAISQPVALPSGHLAHLEGVIGEAGYPQDGDDENALLSAADASMALARRRIADAQTESDT